MPTVQTESTVDHVPNAPSGHFSDVKRQIDTVSGAYGLAWVVWMVYLAIPLFVFVNVVFYMLIHTSTMNYHFHGEVWFVAVSIWMALSVPAAYLIRAKYFFHNYWVGKPVKPRQYFQGMLLIWTVMEITGILALFGCLFTGELIPNILPAVLAFIVFIVQWPNASAMTESTGHMDDSSVFQHPR